MYAVIRAGGKQYRVAPGDVIRVEKVDGLGPVEFPVLAVSAAEGEVARPQQAHAVGQVVSQGRGDKVLVFHYKRKKQYKKIFGHRQPFTAVRITEIAFDGQKFTAPEAPAKKAEKAKPRAEAAGEAHAANKAPAKKAKPAEAKHAAEAKHKTAAKAKGKSSKGKKKQ
jgi:large subunit ribosomal protein L21